MARFTPKVVTANALLEGDVVYLTADDRWTRRHEDAELIEDEAHAQLRLLHAMSQGNVVVGAYLADAEYAAIEQQNLQQEQLLVELRELYDNLGDIEEEIEELRVDIPRAPEVDDFVDAAQAAATTTGVTLQRVSASEPTIYGVASGTDVVPTDEPTSAAPAAVEGAFVVPVTVDVQGSPEAIIRFSELVQRGPRLYLVQSLALAPDTGVATFTGYLFVVADQSGASPETPEQ